MGELGGSCLDEQDGASTVLKGSSLLHFRTSLSGANRLYSWAHLWLIDAFLISARWRASGVNDI